MEVKSNKVAGWDDLNQPGDFYINRSSGQTYIHFYCPCGVCGREYSCMIPIATGEKIDKSWQWDGNEESPTLQPSIQRHVSIQENVEHGIHKHECSWHGYLTDGVFRSC
jgi:hypothetical protein